MGRGRRRRGGGEGGEKEEEEQEEEKEEHGEEEGREEEEEEEEVFTPFSYKVFCFKSLGPPPWCHPAPFFLLPYFEGIILQIFSRIIFSFSLQCSL